LSGEIRIGISSCLLGEQVRYDGGHKRDRFVDETLRPFVTFVPVCPEVELGLGTPREAIRIERSGDALRLVGTRSGRDHTRAMRAYAARRAAALARLDLSGYILKKGSPSCGMERVPVYSSVSAASTARAAAGGKERTGRGFFATELIARLPLLPVEEEGRLQDPKLRENFIERVFAHRRVTDLFAGRWTVGDVVRFHTREKMLLLAHSRVDYDALGRLVANARALSRAELAERYAAGFMSALGKIATRGRHANVLSHMAGYFKRAIPPSDRAELAAGIDDYRRGLVPLVVPLTLVRHHVRARGVEYLAGQSYLEPHPKELALRNHV
jgi:uncharacterized protein YbgA (DUF1722 family)/uncharacterized protein YbbK (DUF523 family)